MCWYDSVGEVHMGAVHSRIIFYFVKKCVSCVELKKGLGSKRLVGARRGSPFRWVGAAGQLSIQ